MTSWWFLRPSQNPCVSRLMSGRGLETLLLPEDAISTTSEE